MVNFSKYEAYKETHILGVDSIPNHWRILPLCSISKIKSISNCQEKELLSVYLELGVIRFSDVNEKRTNATSEDLSKYQDVSPGDFVLNNQQAWRGSVGVSKYEGIVSPAYIVLELATDVDSRFANYYFRHGAMVSQYLICSKGVGTIQRNLYWPQLKRVPVALPPLMEQRRIADFLDQKTAEIDEAIAKKHRLIDLLKEQKTILINQAVTKGLNLNVPMRDSSVLWIGEVPAHWNEKKAKFLFTQSRLNVRKEDDVVTAYRDGQVTLRSKRRTEGYTVAILEQGYQGIRKGQLVLNSMDAFAGAIGVSDSDGKCSPEYVICDPIDQKEVVPMYYALLLREMALSGYIEVISSAVRQRAMRIRFNNLASLLLPVPPLREQNEIAERVSHIKEKVDAVMDNLSHEIDAIKEYGTILISNAVTGKIKI